MYKYIFVNFLLKCGVEGMIHSFFIFYMSIYGVAHSTLEGGYRVDYGLVQL